MFGLHLEDCRLEAVQVVFVMGELERASPFDLCNRPTQDALWQEVPGVLLSNLHDPIVRAHGILRVTIAATQTILFECSTTPGLPLRQ